MAQTTLASIADVNDLIPVLSREPMPIAFSRARLFQTPRYAVFADLRSNAMLGSFVHYTVCEKSGYVYDLRKPIYESACLEDIADVWSIYQRG